ncbi:MAG: hypothetical protein SH819_12830 [Cytophagales bacterium]|nr:hypothetical protein [Cytophagales bacterium]
MIRSLFVLCGILSLSVASAQQTESYLHNRTMLERMSSQGVVGNVVPLANMAGNTPGLIGDVYLQTDYRNTVFLLYDQDKVTQVYAARLDLQRNEFDIKVGAGVRSLSGGLVRSLFWKDSLTNSPQYFVNGKEYKNEEDVPYFGFFQILAEGELTMLKMSELYFRPADRNMAHSVGSKDNKFIKNQHLYYAVGHKAVKLPNRKSVRKLFDSQAVEMEKFIKVNEIDLSQERHVIAAFEHYNALVRK